MDQKPRLFIFERREVSVLFLLAVFVAFFAFTLGVHFGKRISPDASTGIAPNGEAEHAAVDPAAEAVPDKAQLAEAARDLPHAGDDSVAKALQDEVAKTGIKLEKPIQVDLPSDAKSRGDDEKQAARPAGKFTLQVGAFPSEPEAKGRLKDLQRVEENAFVSSAEVHNQKWYRVYMGQFESKNEADRRGKHLVAKRVIQSYVVSRMPQ